MKRIDLTDSFQFNKFIEEYGHKIYFQPDYIAECIVTKAGTAGIGDTIFLDEDDNIKSIIATEILEQVLANKSNAVTQEVKRKIQNVFLVQQKCGCFTTVCRQYDDGLFDIKDVDGMFKSISDKYLQENYDVKNTSFRFDTAINLLKLGIEVTQAGTKKVFYYDRKFKQLFCDNATYTPTNEDIFQRTYFVSAKNREKLWLENSTKM